MYSVSQKVVIRHRKPVNEHRAGDGVEYSVLINKSKIGSSFRGRSINRGLTHLEEDLYLPRIIGVPANAVQFRDACDTYWKDIAVTVPAPLTIEDKTTGLILEVGFEYRTEEDKKAGEAEASKELGRFHAALEKDEVYEMSYDIRNKVGVPISVADFVLYRYCLVYAPVAKLERHMNKSPNIRFFMTNPEMENKAKAVTLDLRKKAYGKYLELAADRNVLTNLFYAFEVERKAMAANDNVHFDITKENDVDLCLEKIVNAYPAQFVAMAADKQLTARAFIIRCLEANILRRVANTDRIVYADNTVIGNSVADAITFLMDEKNLQIKQELQAKMDIKKPSK